MPTGYTFKVANGTETSLREYALRCARGMGALIMMRDEPVDAPIPERFEPSDYHAKKRDEAVERLKALKAMDTAAIEAAAAEWNARNDEYNADCVSKNSAQRERYERLIAETGAWEGAPDGLKDFMLQQLRQSLDFDVSDDPLRYASAPRTADEWWGEECQEAARNIAYHTKNYEEEVERTEARNAWLAQLRAAIALAEGRTETKGGASDE